MLTREEAIARKKCIKGNPNYQIYLFLEKSCDYFGVASFDFELLDTNNLFLDFQGKQIHEMIINNV